MQSHPEVSIIVPLYNAEKYIARCLDSLLSQTFENIEVVIINDGSTDDSREICEEFSHRDSRIKIFDMSNSGVSAARNKGISYCRGEWILFVDSDDAIDHNTVEVLLELQKRQNVDTVVYSFIFEFKDSEKAHKLPNQSINVCDLLQSYITLESADVVLCSTCNKLYRKSIIVDNNIRFALDLPYGEDFDFNSKYFSYSPELYTTDLVFYHYDCGVPNSGVKKVRENYDVIINRLDQAFRQLYLNLGCDLSMVSEFYMKFIAEKWHYAMYLLLNSDESTVARVNLLMKWGMSINHYILAWLSRYTDNSRLYHILSINDSLQRRIQLHIYIRCHSVKKKWMSLKSFIKKLLKR